MVGDNRIHFSNAAIDTTPARDGHRDVASRTYSYCCSQTISVPFVDSRTTFPTSPNHWIRERLTKHRPPEDDNRSPRPVHILGIGWCQQLTPFTRCLAHVVQCPPIPSTAVWGQQDSVTAVPMWDQYSPLSTANDVNSGRNNIYNGDVSSGKKFCLQMIAVTTFPMLMAVSEYDDVDMNITAAFCRTTDGVGEVWRYGVGLHSTTEHTFMSSDNGWSGT